MMRFIVLLIVCIIVSCNNNNNIPSNIIKPEKMENILWDMIKGDLLTQEIIRKDSTQNLKNTDLKITEKIFAIHNTDKVQFEKSLIFYEKHPVLFRALFDSLNSIQTKKNAFEIETKLKTPKEYKFSRGQ